MTHAHRTTLAALALGALLSASASADDAFLKLSDIPGDSTDPQHPNEIALISYAFGLDANSSWTGGGGAQVSKPVPGDVRITAALDRSLGGMLAKIAGGKVTASAVLSVRGSAPGNRTGFEYVKYTFGNVLFTNVDQAIGPTGRAISGASMVYKSIQVEQFSPVDGQRVSCVSWDVTTSVVEDCTASR